MKTMDKIFYKLRKEIQGVGWTKDPIQKKLYEMEVYQENPESPSLKNRSEYMKLIDEWNYKRKYEWEIENRKVEIIPQLESLTEITGGTIKEINNYFTRQEQLKEMAKASTLHYYFNNKIQT